MKINKIVLVLVTTMGILFSCSSDDSSSTPNDDTPQADECPPAIADVISKLDVFGKTPQDNIELLNENCTKYKESLQKQIEACGDTDNKLKEAIDGLDCDKLVFTDCATNLKELVTETDKFEASLLNRELAPANCGMLKEILTAQIANCEENKEFYETQLAQLGDCDYSDNNIIGFMSFDAEIVKTIPVGNGNTTESSFTKKVYYDIRLDLDSEFYIVSGDNNYRIEFQHFLNNIGADWMEDFKLFIDEDLHINRIGASSAAVISNTTINTETQLEFTFEAEVDNRNFTRKVLITNGVVKLRRFVQ